MYECKKIVVPLNLTMSIYQSVSQSIYILFREEKEKYIKAKYERKEFLAPLPPSSISPAKGLVDAICRLVIKFLY